MQLNFILITLLPLAVLSIGRPINEGSLERRIFNYEPDTVGTHAEHIGGDPATENKFFKRQVSFPNEFRREDK
ncbi:hypothetical protein CVT26_003513 [Gymnopilus dilepis]|uniref:Uncharacterized protein n=1 Tax=Gymnopilus dilepis TaxID=231916 RepID=A0A409W321_9AGAR|nr:hypothetical protein CVT26_003513 [Gymnopilus dilepis]